MLFLEKFSIQNDFFLTEQEQKILFFLYQPLTGANVLALYNTLYFLKKTTNSQFNYSHQFLFDLLNIDDVIFTKYKEKLEAINLLSTFQNDKKETIYLIKKPLNYDEFLQDPILSQFLLSEVGEEMFLQLQNLFTPLLKENIISENYKNISKNFSDVYCFRRIDVKKDIIKFSHKTKNNSNSFFQKYFNYEEFMDKLTPKFKKPFLLEWKNIEYITKLSFIYEINPVKMAKLYKEFFRDNEDNNADLNNFKIYIKNKYLKDNVRLTKVNKKNIDNEENEMIFYLKNSHPNRIISNFMKNTYICFDLYDIAFELIKKNNVDIGIINALFMYIFNKKKKDDKFPTSYNYFKTVLDSWMKKGIVTVESAYNFLTEDKQFWNDNNKFNNKNRPQWFDKMRKDLGFKN
ncbi:replication initiation and membrane attachment protein [Candidatus Phytoplasma luffae]|uniref:Replication initiation and membrane attachment protein n=1 Tax=Loofah witches'-broom phytoplasma TaxID=35773 RepID=A0A975FJU9_LOWBP|nr:DnaD domain protein [Candidatus Phytoplasma luffae]QTX03252.1 replication initiation and membrane attachment protein [Candidatus Phytoplasma luffae]